MQDLVRSQKMLNQPVSGARLARNGQSQTERQAGNEVLLPFTDVLGLRKIVRAALDSGSGYNLAAGAEKCSLETCDVQLGKLSLDCK
jgi:hypothetical protein